MARCGNRGCSCTSCEDCGNLHESCICDLKQRTKAFLKPTEVGEVVDATRAIALLKEWLNAN